MERLNSFPLKVSLPTIGITILLIAFLGFLSANTARRNTINIIFDKLLSAVYSRIEYDTAGHTDLTTLIGEVTHEGNCTQTAQQLFDLDKVSVCDDGTKHIIIPTLEGLTPHIYSGLVSISIWDAERTLIDSYPELDEETAGRLERNQRKILDWRLGSDNSDFPNGFIFRNIPDRYPLNFFNRDVIYGIPIYDATKTDLIGSMILIISPSSFSNRWIATRAFMLVVLPIFLISSLFGSFFVAREIRRRIRRVQGITQQWAVGDFSPRISDKSRDEIGLLGQDLNQMAHQLEELMDTKALLAKAETQQKIARDLHDAAKQQLFAATMQLSAANSLLEQKPESARTHLANATDLTKQAQQELSAVINELRPVRLNKQTYEEAIEELVQDFSRQQLLPIELTQTLKRPVPKQMEQPIYKIIQEALSNITKHSGATVAEIFLLSDAVRVKLIVRDNGRGFDPTKRAAGFGLESMQHRAEELGGKLTINSDEKGTTILITC